MLLYTDTSLNSTTWKQAFEDLNIIHSGHVDNQVAHDLVWVVCGIKNWQAIVQQAVKQNNQVIVLSRNPSINELKKCLELGARGYVDALSNANILQAAFQGVKAGGLWIPETYLNDLIGKIQPKIAQSNPPSLNNLSSAEIKVAEKVALGESNKEVAEQLNVCERTIKSHLTSIYQKLDIRDRMHLMLYMQGQQNANFSD